MFDTRLVSAAGSTPPPPIPEDPPRRVAGGPNLHRFAGGKTPIEPLQSPTTATARYEPDPHHHDFVQLWIGDTGSQLGAALGSLAVPYLAVTALDATAFQMGLLATLSGIRLL